jgi:hypothetical protein
VEYLSFVADSGQTVETVYANGNVWLTQKMMGLLYGVDVGTIDCHLTKISAKRDFKENPFIRNFRITAADGKSYETPHYNYWAVITVGDQLNSERKRQFSKWAMDSNYFDELRWSITQRDLDLIVTPLTEKEIENLPAGLPKSHRDFLLQIGRIDIEGWYEFPYGIYVPIYWEDEKSLASGEPKEPKSFLCFALDDNWNIFGYFTSKSPFEIGRSHMGDFRPGQCDEDFLGVVERILEIPCYWRRRWRERVEKVLGLPLDKEEQKVEIAQNNGN